MTMTRHFAKQLTHAVEQAGLARRTISTDGMCSSVDDMDGHTGTYPGEESGQIPGGAVQGQKIGAEDAGREDSETTVLTPRGDLWGRGGDEITRAAWPQ